MAVPDYQTLMLPLLRALSDGHPHSLAETVDQVAQSLHLDASELNERIPSGQLALPNRIGWARSYMGKAGLIASPGRGRWQITQVGLLLLAEHPERIDNQVLSRYQAFQTFRLQSRRKRVGRASTGSHNGQPGAEPATTVELPFEPVIDASEEANGQAEDEPQAALSLTDAAEQILREFANRQPMSYRAITQRAVAMGLTGKLGETPASTLWAQVGTEIARDEQRGARPRFFRRGRGLIGLTAWDSGGLSDQIAQHNAEVRSLLHQRLIRMSPTDFETLIGQLLVKLGFADVEVTSRSGDGGIDVRGTLVVGDVIRTRMAVQVKRWRNNVQAPIVQQVRGSLGTHEQGLIITTSDFSPGARTEAERSNAVPVGLMSGEQLVRLLVEHELGAKRAPHVLIELDPDPAESNGVQESP